MELALAENFCMDFTLLCCSKFAVRNRAGYRRIAAASALGACFAAVFPLWGVTGVLSVLVKIAAGLAMCFISGRFSRFMEYVKYAAAFAGFSALAGGAIIGVFTLAGWEYSAGDGYLLSSVPVGIPLFFTLVLALAVRRVALKLKRGSKTAVHCRIYAGERQVEGEGFFDSGNRVYRGGEPVSFIPPSAAEKLVDCTRINDSVKIHTVAGSRAVKVFVADRLVICKDGGERTVEKAVIGVSLRDDGQFIINPDLSEE